MSRRERTRIYSESNSRLMNLLLVVIGVAFIGAAYFSGKEMLDILGKRYTSNENDKVLFDELKSIITETAASFGVNPGDINWADPDRDPDNPEKSLLNKIKISSLYSKMIFHREFMENIVAAGYVISDCVESSDGKRLDFTLTGEDGSEFEFRLISARGVSPLASRLSVIIDNVQSTSGLVRGKLQNLGVMYGYILTPGKAGFTKTREALLTIGQQVLYEIPLQEDRFVRLMNAAAPIVGLKKVRNFEQAINVIQRLTGNFKYLFCRGTTNSIDKKMANYLGNAGFVIFSDSEEINGELEIFINSGGKSIKNIPVIESGREGYQRMKILEHHRKILMSDNWGALIIKADDKTPDEIKEAVQKLTRLNCKITPVSQLLLRIR